MNKKAVSWIAIIVSSLIVLFGVLILAGVLGGDTGHASSSSFLYDSGYAEFGADFYTYVSNNAAEAASAARTVASNLDDIAMLLKSACGVFLIGFGLLSLCHFALVLVDEKKVLPEMPEEILPTEPEEVLPAEPEES